MIDHSLPRPELTVEEVVEGCKLAAEYDVATVCVKAAGGVRSLDAALAVRAVGTVRFGATATKQIVEDARKRENEGTLAITGGELAGGY